MTIREALGALLVNKAAASTIAGTVLFTVYGQIVLKWQMSQAGDLPAGFGPGIQFVLRQLANPWIMSGFVAAALAALCWLAALSNFDLSFAYPFMASSFALVLVLSALLLGEDLTVGKVVSVAFVCVGLIIGSLL